jgi:hypothetical protein
MANRTPAAEHISERAHRMRIDGKVWVRDDWVEEDIEHICDGLQSDPEYVVEIRSDSLFITLADKPG